MSEVGIESGPSLDEATRHALEDVAARLSVSIGRGHSRSDLGRARRDTLEDLRHSLARFSRSSMD
ncbi:MAG: hypothetical protein GY910_28325 [bacterium]|nr:hypothetical protein [Deltaproteobacteria bacterium]MCP4908902.1 hypothetical protein [bacterium]